MEAAHTGLDDPKMRWKLRDLNEQIVALQEGRRLDQDAFKTQAAALEGKIADQRRYYESEVDVLTRELSSAKEQFETCIAAFEDTMIKLAGALTALSDQAAGVEEDKRQDRAAHKAELEEVIEYYKTQLLQYEEEEKVMQEMNGAMKVELRRALDDEKDEVQTLVRQLKEARKGASATEKKERQHARDLAMSSSTSKKVELACKPFQDRILRLEERIEVEREEGNMKLASMRATVEAERASQKLERERWSHSHLEIDFLREKVHQLERELRMQRERKKKEVDKLQTLMEIDRRRHTMEIGAVKDTLKLKKDPTSSPSKQHGRHL